MSFQYIFSVFTTFYNNNVNRSASTSKQVFNFNILNEQCGNIVENSHTNILMRLLQYKNRFGYVFLEDFISMAGFNIKIKSNDVKFHTEYFGNVNAKSGRIDGLIYEKGKFAIIIENKINHAGNQNQQIKRYIDTVLYDGIVSVDNIYVVFLTRDGVEIPDSVSLTYMKNAGICDNNNTNNGNVISGDRYFACSYSEHIYNWLKDVIQPQITQKDFIFNAGVIQYIDYLEILLGKRVNNQPLFNDALDWFNQNIVINDNVEKINKTLYEFSKYLAKLNPNNSLTKDIINLLTSVIVKKNDDLMGNFLTVTKEFFTGGATPIMKDYCLSHHFTYYYINFRDKAWPVGINFSWYPLGMKKLLKEEKKLTLSFNYKKQGLGSKEENQLSSLGFVYDQKSKSYRTTIDLKNTSFLNLTNDKQRDLLENVYNEKVAPVIKNLSHLFIP